MKPPIISLPDGLRDQLEEALKAIGDDPAIADKERAAAACVKRLMYREETGTGLVPIHDALLGLQTGHSAPAILFENLPPTQGELFSFGLFRMLGQHDMAVPNRPEGGVAAGRIHMDRAYYSTLGKRLRGLYAKDPGTPAQPTIYISPDEIIHAHTCEALGLPIRASADEVHRASLDSRYHELREAYIRKLEDIGVSCYTYLDRGERFFLRRNPNYQPGIGASEFVLCWPELAVSSLSNSIRDGADRAAYNGFIACGEKLRVSAGEESQASLHRNTLVVWNDAHVLHDRLGNDKTRNRMLISIDAFPHYSNPALENHSDANGVLPEAHAVDPTGQASGNPCSLIGKYRHMDALVHPLPKGQAIR